MDDVRDLPAGGGKGNRALGRLGRSGQRLCFTALAAWCLLPLVVCVYCLLTGALGGFDGKMSPAQIAAGSYYYKSTVAFYYRCFLTLGAGTEALAVAMLALSWRRLWRREAFRCQPWPYLLGALLLWAAVCAALAVDPHFAVFGDTYRHDGLISYFVYGSVLVCALTVQREDYRRWLLRLYAAVICLLAVVMLGRDSGISFLVLCFPSRAATVFNQFNHMGYMLCTATLAAAGLYLYDDTVRRRGKAVYLAGIALLVYALLENDTFGAFLGVAAGLVALYVFYLRRNRRLSARALLPGLVFLALAAASAAGLLTAAATLGKNAATLQSDVTNIVQGNEQAARAGSTRWTLWRDTFRRICQHPIFGVGPLGLWGENAIANNDAPHNEYLQMGAYMGLPGLALYLSALVTMLVGQWRRLPQLPPMVAAAAGALAAYLASAFFGNPLFNTYPYLWLMLGLASGTGEEALIDPTAHPAAERAPEEPALPRQRLSRRKLVLLLALVAVLTAGLLAGTHALRRRAECNAEQADLQCMRIAELTALRAVMDGEVPEAAVFWFDAGNMALVTSDGDIPAPYGMGAALPGGGLAAFTAQTGMHYDYDEAADYTACILAVTVDPAAPEGQQVTVQWQTAPAQTE